MTIETKLASAIGGRRSIRRYNSALVDEAVIERLLVAATKAPSAHNRQPWRFAVLVDAESKHKLASAMGKRLRHDRTADGDDPTAIEADVARSYARLTEAPLVIVASLDTSDMDRYSDKRRGDAEHLMAVQSTAMAMQNSTARRAERGTRRLHHVRTSFLSGRGRRGAHVAGWLGAANIGDHWQPGQCRQGAPTPALARRCALEAARRSLNAIARRRLDRISRSSAAE